MLIIDRGENGFRKSISWYTVKYGNVTGKYLYNRCYLIGYQLVGEKIKCPQKKQGREALFFWGETFSGIVIRARCRKGR